MNCQRCQGGRVLVAHLTSEDCHGRCNFKLSVGDTRFYHDQSMVPDDIGIGDPDNTMSLHFHFCLDCGQIQEISQPLPESQVERDEVSRLLSGGR